MSGVSRSSEDIPEIILLGPVNVFLLWHSMVIFAVDAFSACASCEIHAEVSAVLLLKVVSFCISGVDFWLELRERGGSFDFDIAISQVLVVPNIVIVVAFFVRGIFLALIDLLASCSLHPFMSLKVFELSELIDFL